MEKREKIPYTSPTVEMEIVSSKDVITLSGKDEGGFSMTAMFEDFFGTSEANGSFD